MITQDTAWAFKPSIRNKFYKNNPMLERIGLSLLRKPQGKRHKSRDSQGFVYFIQCNEFTKIGMATNPQQRLAELSCSTPYTLKLMRTVPTPTMLNTENMLHRRFGECHHAKEWFALPKDVLELVVTLTDQQIADGNF